MHYVTKELEISSAHKLCKYEGKCKNVHGHNYKVQATLKINDSDFRENGMGIDFGEIKLALKELDEKYDHTYLNDIEPFNQCETDTKRFNPTAENMARVFYEFLKEKLPQLYSVTIYETPNSFVTYVSDEEKFRK